MTIVSVPDSPLTPGPELIKACQKGDRQGFQQLYHHYHQRVRSTLYQLCGELALDDLEQEVFLRVWQSLPQLRKVNYFSTWLYRITWNVAMDHRQRLGKHRQDQQSLMAQAQGTQGGRSNGGGELLQIHYQDLVQRGLEQLTWEQRSVVVLHDLRDLPQKEIAQILQIPVGTVKSRLFQGRKNLHRSLREEGVQL